MLPELNGYAIPAADLLCDQLCDCGFDDPEWNDPAEWLSWTDADRFELGAEAIPDAPVPDPDQLPGEETPLEGPDPDDTGEYFPDPDRMGEAERELSHDFEPDPDEIADYREWCMATDREWWDDQIERAEIEATCNGRFV